MRQHLNKCEFHRHTDRQTYRHLALFRLVKVFSSFELSCFDLYAPIYVPIGKIGKEGKLGNLGKKGILDKMEK